MIIRDLTSVVQKNINKGKVIVLIGPRQVGKTTLINSLLKDIPFLFLDGDDAVVSDTLASANTETLKNIIGNYKYVFIDEVQRIPNIGLKLKIIVDQIKDVQVIVSGSSAFDINHVTQEPLTGRKFEYHLYAISWNEFESNVGYIKAQQQLELRLLYGMYPDVINNFGNEYEILKNLVSSYLYKDVLSLAGIRKSEVLEKILQALALQVGSEVSYNEIAQLVGVDKNTVSTYIDVLEKAFVIFRLNSFSKNIRNEIKANRKIYFYDNGVRNMLIGNFNTLEFRQDKGALWENFLVSERIKMLSYTDSLAKPYFWRTTQQQEIDYIETNADVISAFEFKWSSNKKIKLPKSFQEAYQPSFLVVSKENFREFLK
ncbi:putative AAA+ superfamily ATPase [Flavobacterium sp. CG_23.5]|uniref:ATP-binding protein n=1 Tax=unclassified Flavobacterium TaxID=196869 RepID=UPI0018C9821B|nr:MULTISPECIES: ATP-binding protein [unclassified Flavobacterium]MBG6109971.1 putative AAA+ superfamily ATPase [Flavobacterium sp. CG_9.10]MBP2283212.1 putative AAA+ superfamily ATPase [Flavobacterium sp. CG_23.5]